MSEIIIKTENISKQYRLGTVGTGTLSHDINRWWHKIRGKEDPFLKIGEENERSVKGGSDYVWALRDINFDVHRGDILGIIGRNGAGKSTLLKILSRTTTPTTGNIKIKGRVASLLEVGTGFHPELTGRENVYLNGAILGMTKSEIRSKFDEIVDFAGVERYIDTPVKRYSSGMYVRLAFGVAAHLEPEILIVDEVLAVGDAEFQKKALGKMKDVSNKDGRTVLFVSHNMAAVKGLCTNGIVMEKGTIVYSGNQIDSVSFYQKGNNATSFSYNDNDENEINTNSKFLLKKLEVKSSYSDYIDITSGFTIDCKFHNNQENKSLAISLFILNEDELIIFEAYNIYAEDNNSKIGAYNIKFLIPGNLLNAGRYFINIIVAESQKYIIYQEEKIVAFEIENTLTGVGQNLNKVPGIIRPTFRTEVEFKNYA